MTEDEEWDVDDAIRAEIIEVDREKDELCRLIRRLHDEVDPCTRESGNVGGHLHIILDDGNVRDSDVHFCLSEAVTEGCAPCQRIGEKLKLLTADQREALYENEWSL